MLRLMAITFRLSQPCRVFRIAAVAGFMCVVALMSSTVSASCGDYLVDQSERQMMAEHNAVATEDSDRATDRPTRQRCNGPQCHNRSSLPTTPMPSTSSTVPSKHATACVIANAKHACPFIGTTVEATAHAHSGFPLDVLRPPRTSMPKSVS